MERGLSPTPTLPLPLLDCHDNRLRIETALDERKVVVATYGAYLKQYALKLFNRFAFVLDVVDTGNFSDCVYGNRAVVLDIIGDIKSFPDLYKCGNDLTVHSSNVLDAPKHLYGGSSSRVISSTCPP